jgi:hypothetical protein
VAFGGVFCFRLKKAKAEFAEQMCPAARWGIDAILVTNETKAAGCILLMILEREELYV